MNRVLCSSFKNLLRIEKKKSTYMKDSKSISSLLILYSSQITRCNDEEIFANKFIQFLSFS